MSSIRVFALVCAVLFFCGESCSFDRATRKWAAARVKMVGGCKAVSAGNVPSEKKAPAAKVFLYHNDENETIGDFMQYYSYLFGAKNIIVIDQDSQNPEVCKTLAMFQHCGTKIITNKKSYFHKGAGMSEEMRRYKDAFLIPLDADEFIFPFAKNSTRQVAVNREDLWNAFRALPMDGRKFKFSFYTAAHPKRSTCLSAAASPDPSKYRRLIENDAFIPMYTPVPGAKSFFHSEGFIRTDDGNHIGLVKNDNDTSYHVNQTNIPRYFANLDAQLVHFAVGSYQGAHDKYRRASITMGYNADTNCTVRRPGGHYCALCKNYVNGTDHGMKHYTDNCIPHRSYNYTVVSDWFKKYTLSMKKLVG